MQRKLTNVLVVDDDEPDRRLVERALVKSTQESEFTIETAESLSDCLKLIESDRFDLVLLDLGLPDSRGLKTVEQVHEKFPNIPIMVLTGLEDESIGIESIKKGAIDYITKPFSPISLRIRIGIVRQIIELQNKLLLAANCDGLTGLANRRHFFDILSREVLQAKIKGSSLSVMMIDMDHFKSINDNYGHRSGDMVLQQMGKILQENLYPLDVACRYVGEEFIVLMPDTTMETAAAAAERLRSIIDKYQWMIPSKQISITVSIGIASTDFDKMNNPQELVDKADSALYAAKHNGRNCIVQWDKMNQIKKEENKDPVFYELQMKVSSLVNQLHSYAIGTISSLIETMDVVVKDPYIIQHGKNVKFYSEAIAKKMGLSAELQARIGTAAMLQDIGMIGIPANILKKTTNLSEEELRLIRQHTITAVRILKPIEIFDNEADIIKHHHERYDGSGYPDGLKGKEIPIGSRILAAADAFDSIISNCHYHAASDFDGALKEIQRCSGSQFDPDVVLALEEVVMQNATVSL